MANIHSFNIDTSEMPAAVTTRNFSVHGDDGAEFILYALENDTLKYYDFNSREFALGHNSKNNYLKIKLSNIPHNDTIVFPSGGGTYTINLETTEGTEVLKSNQKVISKSIEKLSSNATVTFKAATANTSNYATFPTSTSTGAPNSSSKFDFDWDIVNASTDAGGFGLRIPNVSTANQISDSFWYFSARSAVDGAVSSGTEVVVDDTTDIIVGMVITEVSGGSLSGEPSIMAINTSTKTLTISAAQTFADGITLTFKAIGSAKIKKATGLTVKFIEYPTVTPETLKKTVRAGSSGTTINLNGTYGVTGGSYTSISGFNIDNSSDNKVISVSASSTAGSIVVGASQFDLATNIGLTFPDVYQTINIVGTIDITRFPTANITIYLDIDKFITPGVASP